MCIYVSLSLSLSLYIYIERETYIYTYRERGRDRQIDLDLDIDIDIDIDTCPPGRRFRRAPPAAVDAAARRAPRGPPESRLARGAPTGRDIT